MYICIEGLLRTLRKGFDGTSNTELSKNPTSPLSLSLKCQAPYRYTHFFNFFFFNSSSEFLLSGIWLSGILPSSTSSQNTSYFYQKLHFIEKEGEGDCVIYSLVFFSCFLTVASIMKCNDKCHILFFQGYGDKIININKNINLSSLYIICIIYNLFIYNICIIFLSPFYKGDQSSWEHAQCT